MSSRLELLTDHVDALRDCAACPDMIPPVIVGTPVISPVVLLGQAPGIKEGERGKPFAFTAGTTLFKWMARIGIDEEAFRRSIYMAAVCRCFPGKNPKAKGKAAGDRVPRPDEIANCSRHLAREVELLAPRLILPVGKLAIAQLIPFKKLADVVGRQFRVEYAGRAMDAVPLPHPSGASTWFKTKPGIDLLDAALDLIRSHDAWAEVLEAAGA